MTVAIPGYLHIYFLIIFGLLPPNCIVLKTPGCHNLLFCFCFFVVVFFFSPGSKGGTINYLDGEGCHEPRCFFVRQGSNYTLHVSFTASKYCDSRSATEQ